MGEVGKIRTDSGSVRYEKVVEGRMKGSDWLILYSYEKYTDGEFVSVGGKTYKILGCYNTRKNGYDYEVVAQ